MHKVSANYTLPTILNTLKPSVSNGLKKASAATPGTMASGTTSSSTTSGGLDSTFLNLLAQELQHQDPTAPMDSTAMVGQMISLNQLDQLISINQSITGSSTTGVTPPTTSVAGALSSTSGGLASLLSPSTSAAASTQLPFDPNTMMPLGTGNAGAVAASINSSLNAATLGLSGTTNGTNNNTSGGK
jgi:flagellar basal-body rod modification protein FlgD